MFYEGQIDGSQIQIEALVDTLGNYSRILVTYTIKAGDTIFENNEYI